VKKRIVLFLILANVCTLLMAGVNLDVKIFTGYRISSLSVTPTIGKYSFYDNDIVIADVLKTETITFSVVGDSIRVEKQGKIIGNYAYIVLSGGSLINSMKIKPLDPNVKEREYDDDLHLSVVNGALLIINHVDLEHYVAGVVQSEGGGSVKENEFYEVQAICCRTYALNNSKKHSKEDFNLCDSVHCQLYMGKCSDVNIQSAAFNTLGDVIVDKKGRMISAAFHSNSGGETANSEDVWTISTPYLKSVVDTFSLHMPNATWEKTMPVSEWLMYLSARWSYPVNDPDKKAQVLDFTQEHRLVYFRDSIRLSAIRTDLGLKSAFFSIKKSGDNVVFSGKGYGHGVGLSQQGAIRMAQLGYTYSQIIKFYYQDVDIMSYDQLMTRNY
jgi:stage II sporulation protein D